MKPENGQHIKCVLKNGIVVEGILEDWSNNIVLRSLDNARQILIHSQEDVMMTTIFIKPVTDLEQKFQEVYEQPSDVPERTASLAELRSQMAEQDKQIIANKLRSHHISETRKVQYGFPRLHQKLRPK